MVRISMRLCSKAASSSAAAAAEFLQRTSKAGSFVQEQFLDPNQLQKLSLTLGRPTLYKSLRIDSKPPPQGTPLPPGYHLAYFTPSGCEQELGRDGTITRDHCQSPVSLFRFSALTFNAHKIHYSREWCRDVEGHRDIVVHGPLNLINMLDLWRDNQEAGDHVIPQSIDYRATSPLYAGDRYRAVMEKGENGHADNLSIYTPSGAVAMRGKITTL
ncbi:hypothetical protein VE04_05982 [Pseudogymnoascus sp. 24MN13]|nr:hypothetical protein VE04_05982 [Pseudogymnoascus sp. 24MN13]